MVLIRNSVLLSIIVPFAACTVPRPAAAPTHVVGPQTHGAANSLAHLEIMTMLSRCARADQQRQQGGLAPADAPTAAQCAAAERMSRSEAEYQLAQPQ